MRKFLFLILGLILFPSFSFATTLGDVQGAVYVHNYDGDSITFDLPYPHFIRLSIRVNGIDTPEIKGKCKKEIYSAQKAQQMVADILGDAEQIIL